MRRLLASVMIATVATAGVAQAQETGSLRADTAPIMVEEGNATGDAARGVYDSFALCIVKRHYVQVRKALAGAPDMAADMQTLPKLMDKECFFGSGSVGRVGGLQSVELTTNPISFRGALFKALVIKDFARRPAAFGPVAQTLTGDNSDVLQFADCVVRADPAGSLKLLRAKAGTAAEASALAELTPRLSPCSAQARRRVSKAVLVGFLAEAYYREAAANKATGE